MTVQTNIWNCMKPCFGKLLTIIFGFMVSFFSLPASAEQQTLRCLQSPSRVAACPNMIYRSVLDDVTQKNKMICFCKRDFDLLFNKDVTKQQAILNKMELKQITAETGLTKLQLIKMVSR